MKRTIQEMIKNRYYVRFKVVNFRGNIKLEPRPG